MDALFKQRLKELAQAPTITTFEAAIMGETHWAEFLEDRAPLAGPISKSQSDLTEKAMVLESFTQFAQEQMEQGQAESFSFPGGEVRHKKDPLQEPFISQFGDLSSWEKQQAFYWGHEMWNIITQGKQHPLQVVFVCESPIDQLPAELPAGLPADLLMGFSVELAQLFVRMVAAMQLSPQQYGLSFVKKNDGEAVPDGLLEMMSWWKPRFVVPLGAQAVTSLLGARERLTQAHGKFYQHPRLKNGPTIVPLFHPSVLINNANMKKATWSDMQKIMSEIKKI